MNGPIAVVILIIGLVAASILSRHLREAKQLRLLEIAHEERIKAMDTGNPLPDAADGRLDSLLRDLSAHQDPSPKNPATAVMWVRLAALCLGLAGLFGGIGTSIGFSVVSDAEVNGLWPLGLIPAFIGLGLLVFFRLSKRLVPTEQEMPPK